MSAEVDEFERVVSEAILSAAKDRVSMSRLVMSLLTAARMCADYGGMKDEALQMNLRLICRRPVSESAGGEDA
jgi:hypothetical protein